jgi:hypothetical protein
MSVTAYEVISAHDSAGLTTLITAAIAAGWQPSGAAFTREDNLLCQTLIKGTPNASNLATALLSVGATGVETGLTAHSGGTQAAALALSSTVSVHEVTTVGAGNDSVKLPLATGSGNFHVVKNSAAANSMQLFGSGTDTIDGVTSATGVAVAAGKGRLLCDTSAGNWSSVAGA